MQLLEDSKEKILESHRGSTRSHSLEHSLWKRIWTCRKTLRNDDEVLSWVALYHQQATQTQNVFIVVSPTTITVLQWRHSDALI